MSKTNTYLLEDTSELANRVFDHILLIYLITLNNNGQRRPKTLCKGFCRRWIGSREVDGMTTRAAHNVADWYGGIDSFPDKSTYVALLTDSRMIPVDPKAHHLQHTGHYVANPTATPPDDYEPVPAFQVLRIPKISGCIGQHVTAQGAVPPALHVAANPFPTLTGTIDPSDDAETTTSSCCNGRAGRVPVSVVVTCPFLATLATTKEKVSCYDPTDIRISRLPSIHLLPPRQIDAPKSPSGSARGRIPSSKHSDWGNL